MFRPPSRGARPITNRSGNDYRANFPAASTGPPAQSSSKRNAATRPGAGTKPLTGARPITNRTTTARTNDVVTSTTGPQASKRNAASSSAAAVRPVDVANRGGGGGGGVSGGNYFHFRRFQQTPRGAVRSSDFRSPPSGRDSTSKGASTGGAAYGSQSNGSCSDSTLVPASNNSGTTRPRGPAGDRERAPRCRKCLQAFCDPRVLRCLHSFCLCCLDGMVVLNNEEEEKREEARGGGVKHVQCVVCNDRTLMPTGCLPKDAEVDFGLRRHMETLPFGPEDGLLCRSCGSGGGHRLATARCFHCPAFLCERCSRVHQTLTVFSGHKVCGLGVTVKRQDVPRACRVHPRSAAVAYCHDCRLAFCQPCRLRHLSCSSKTNASVNPFTVLMANVSFELERAQKRAEGCSRHVSELDPSFKAANKALAEATAECDRLQNERFQSLQRQIDAASTDSRAAAQAQHLACQHYCFQLEKINRFVGVQAKLGLKWDNIQTTRFVESVLRSLAETAQPGDRPLSRSVEFVCGDLKAFAAELGHVHQKPLQPGGAIKGSSDLRSTGAVPSSNVRCHLQRPTPPEDQPAAAPDPSARNQPEDGAAETHPADNSDESDFEHFGPLRMHCLVTFGGRGTGEGQFKEMGGVTVDRGNRLIVADAKTRRIQIFDVYGCFQSQFDISDTCDEALYPNRIAVSETSGNVVITLRGKSPRVQTYTSGGRHLHTFGEGSLQHPRGVAVDRDDNIVVVESKVMRVTIFSMTGGEISKFGCSGHLQFPTGVAVNGVGEIFISDNRAHNVKVFSYSGGLLRQIGGVGLTKFPFGLRLDQRDQLVVASNHNTFHLAVFSQQGELLAALASHSGSAGCVDFALTQDGVAVVARKSGKVCCYPYQQDSRHWPSLQQPR